MPGRRWPLVGGLFPELGCLLPVLLEAQDAVKIRLCNQDAAVVDGSRGADLVHAVASFGVHGRVRRQLAELFDQVGDREHENYPLVGFSSP